MRENVEEMLRMGQQKKIFSQAVLAIKREGKLKLITVGDSQLGQASRFDLASLTKIVGTLMGVLKLLSAAQITLETKLVSIFPELTAPEWAPVTIKHLLTHTSGLISSFKFYHLTNKPTLFEGLARILPGAQGTVVYSDLNFMWLGLVVEAVSGENLATFLTRRVFRPLGMNDTSFSPESAIPTREKGRPDDHNASYFGVPVGHAGLFSSATDLLKFADYWLNPPSSTVVDASWLAASIKVQTPSGQPPRGLGWVLPGNPESFFDDFGSSAYGHTGYTGTSILVVPQRKLSIVLLTDRTRLGVDQRFPQLRRELHSLLAAEL
ncbi:serine hydrolase domain-containing protein [Lacticaseibacillus hegangensis]|uniref:Serine hydrolase domain-containing protein n=1 Tax=Lacticaseibacillus hegangensis TaxID=2486010 RepID=A0ABW4CXS4_9LACO|nr:serine hydrolase domain-containing protein [Lacticaseibacillus hegangensis]